MVGGSTPAKSMNFVIHGGRQVMELYREVAHQQGTAVIVVTYDNRLSPVLSVATPENLT